MAVFVRRERERSKNVGAARPRIERLSLLDAETPINPLARLSFLRRVVAWSKVMLANMDRSRTTGLAAELAFWLFLSLLPLAAVFGLVAARLAMHDQSAIAPVLHAMPVATRELLTTELARVSAWNGGSVGLLAALTFLWLASSGVHSIFDGLEVATDACARPWWKKRLLALATCVGLSIGVAVLTLIGGGVEWIQQLAGKAIHAKETGTNIIDLVMRVVLGAGVAFGLVVGLYWVGLPSRARKQMPLVPGAVFAVLLMAIAAFGYTLYLTHVGDGGAYQAGLAVIGVTMMVLYLFSLAILMGAELNRVVGATRVLRKTVHREVAPPPPITDDMVSCDPDVRPRRPSHARRAASEPTRSGGQRSATRRSGSGATRRSMPSRGSRAADRERRADERS